MQQKRFNPKGKKILAVTAHPDDADFCCGGTLLKWLSMGAVGAIVVATNGDKGSHNESITSEKLAELRQKEQLAASNFLGLEHTWFLEYPDAHLDVTQELKEKLVKIIRSFKPDIIFTWDPTMIYSLKMNRINHPDHRAIGQAAIDACFPMARDRLTFPAQLKGGLETHCVQELFLINFETANYFEDISSVVDKKIELLKTHESQYKPRLAEKLVIDSGARLGKGAQMKYAESFVRLSLEPD